MKRSKQAPKPKKRKKAVPSAVIAPASQPEMTRRALLGKAKVWGIAAGVVGLGGLGLTRTVQAEMYEHDLTRIGKGVPMVVQVHDPQCPTCTALQKQVRKAMKAFGEDQLQYAVASLAKDEGRKLASAHGVGKVTLLLFDAQGNRLDILSGMASSTALEQRFRSIAAS